MTMQFIKEYNKERREHPSLPSKTIARIVKDHMKKR
jgi:hypothetical protein